MAPLPWNPRTKKIIRNLINAYRDMPHLWNKGHADYSNKQLRTEGFKKLVAIYQKAEPDATVHIVRKRIDSLKTIYFKELRKAKRSQLNASFPGDEYESYLWYYNDMRFLENVNPAGDQSMSDEEDPPADQAMSDEEETCSSVTVIKADDNLGNASEVIQNNPLDDDDSEPHFDGEVSSDSHAQPSTSSPVTKDEHEDKDDIIGKSIAVQLKGIGKKQKVIALKLISDAIYYANLGKLKETSCLKL